MNIQLNASALDTYTPARKLFKGKSFIVCPVTILTEGVHAGSNGPVYYPASELSAIPAAWDGVPVTMGHPKVADQFVSAQQPQVLEEWQVGHLFNTTYNETKRALQSEIWVEADLLAEKHPEVFANIEAGNHIEVSTGLFFDSDNLEGAWNGEAFTSTVKNYRPNHLAILPDTKGACSCKDGCGIRANQKKEGLIMNLGEKIRSVIHAFLGNETAMEDKQKALNNLVQGMNKQGPNGNFWHYVEKTYEEEKYCIICQDGPNGTQYFKVDFETDENGIPTKLGTDYQEMVRDVVYNPKVAGNEEGEVKVDPKCGCPIPEVNKGCASKGKNKMMDDEDDEEMEEGVIDKKKFAKNAAELFAANHPGSHSQKVHNPNKSKGGGGGGTGHLDVEASKAKGTDVIKHSFHKDLQAKGFSAPYSGEYVKRGLSKKAALGKEAEMVTHFSKQPGFTYQKSSLGGKPLHIFKGENGKKITIRRTKGKSADLQDVMILIS